MILSRLSALQQDELAAAAVLRVITRPALQTLLPDHPTGEDWLRRLTSRAFLPKLPSPTTSRPAGGPKWQMHNLIRHWMLDYLTDDDADRPSRDHRLPVLHHRAANYFSQLAAGAPATWSLEVAYHCFAIGDPAPADSWHRQLLAAAHVGDLATVATHIEIALAPEQQDRVRGHLPAVTTVAVAAQAWLAYLRNDLDAAEHLALDAAKLATQVHQPALRAWALRLAGQAAYLTWTWTRARAHWQAAVMLTRPTADTAELFPLMAALSEGTAGCGDLPTAAALLDETRQLPGGEPATLPAPSQLVPPLVPLGSHLLRDDPAGRLTLLAAEVALRTGQWDHAQALLDEAAGSSSNNYLRAETLRVHAELALARYHPPDAARFADTAARTLTTAGNRPELRIATLLTQANAALQVSGYGPPLTASPELIPGDPKTFSRSISDAAEARHQQDLAGGYTNAALDLALETDNRHGQASAYLNHGDFDRALALFTEIGDRPGQANTLEGLGTLARLRDDYSAAERRYGEGSTFIDRSATGSGRPTPCADWGHLRRLVALTRLASF